ncbi:glycine zipper 2TM domain-containing protein [Thermodesulforhabdus norvegica]|uniref:Glycine zipper 2TM domain-containing protein n=1 Tax=Thermodesulforhabdus norvegica TaxID=39841 RepID=A0A1I4VRZ0_9BACT|nr:glycine zipper 2TM domain-containing protein [Thermodesulforhabdus norvegica]SFN04061.1 Glycine zipper 2TM domain-containing protein [Thermodesulforhabdus norvegica]
MKKTVVIVLTLLLTFASLTACVPGPSTQQHYETSAWLGAVGAGIGALVDENNRWRGAVIGGALGAVTGYGLAEISQRAAREAAYRRDTVTYYNRTTGEWVQSDPVYYGPDYATVRVRTGYGQQVREERYERVPLNY